MFRNPEWLLWMLPALAAAWLSTAFAARRRARLTAAMGRPETIERLVAPERAPRRAWKAALQLAGIALVFLALSGPQWGVELVTTESSAHAVVVAVDVSLSMTAEDVKPSRIEKAKRELSLILEELKGSRVGIVAFAGEAALVCPMTTDLDAAREILRSLEPGMVPVPGSAVGKAVRLANQSLQRYVGGKSLILLTDGEDHRSAPLEAAREAASLGIRIFAIGIGTPEGEPIPLKDPSGILTGYKKDRRGTTVVSRLGEKTLAQMAAGTGGAYYRASPQENEALEIASQVLKTRKAEGLSSRASRYRNRYLYPLALAFLLLLLEWLIPETRGEPGPALRHLSRGKAAALAAALLWCLAAAAEAGTAEGALRKGNKLYGKKKYAPALEQYAEAGRLAPRDPRPLFNAGAALYRLEEMDRAADTFAALSASKSPRQVRADSWYNLGSARFRQGDFKAAVLGLREAVKMDPKDRDARHNLAVALRALKKPPPPSSGQKGNPQGDKSQQDRKDGKGPSSPEGSPPPPKTRPQDEIKREDAERILRAVAEKENTSRREVQKIPLSNPPPATEEDW